MQIKNEWEDCVSVMHIWRWSEFTCVGVATFIYSRIESISQSVVESGFFFSV